MPSVNFKTQLHLHLIVFIWGFTAILGQLISLNALPLVFTRIAISIVVILGYLFLTKKSLVLKPKDIFRFFIFGFVIAIHWLTFFYAIKISNISITLACISTGAFFTSILEPIFFKRKMIWYEVFLGCLVVVGLLLIFQFETQYKMGILVALLSAFLSASFSIINGKLANSYDSVVISFYELVGGLFILACFLFYQGGFTAANFHFQGYDYLWIGILGTICTAYPFIATIDIMKYLSPYTVMLTINLEPIYGIILAVILFKDQEKMTTAFYFGALIILLTVALNAYFKNRKKANI
ncbi:DMT family transporter [Flavobacterium sp. xlx-214]|uniref:DMT family transporter n=1 Tax=unclassified Flavobacterium TaxID=196869 RepID=UPI0013D17762|nr:MULTISPECIES: DMT family transporter [unclassified Flavobacterium]MBA5791446.1 DMT family transporter [Flavobacterium sp. xlx-221]QMI83403.1 DMT family transporter [Flavobacterium sp. xlx-214]